MRRELVFSIGLWESGREALFPEDGSEGFLFGLARPCRRPDGVVYRVEHLVRPDRGWYSRQSMGGLTLSDGASGRLNLLSAQAAKQGRVPVHLHSHPSGVSDFSGYDDEHERRLHEWLRAQQQPLLWSLVWARGGWPRARLWAANKAIRGQVRVGLQAFGEGKPELLPALTRQIAFGPGLREAARTLQVGIVGLGGVGMQVAEQLARSGFSRFVLIDPDCVEDSNLNRLPGTFPSDVGRLKVRVARRLILQAARCLGTEVRISALPHDIYTAPSRVQGKLRQCDLVLALTDDNLSRLECLRIAFEGGAEYLQAGVDVRLDDRDGIEGLFFEVVGAEEGRFCPACAGRLDLEEASIEARRYVGGEVWEQAQKQGYVKDVPAPSVMSLNALAAGVLVLEIQRRVSGLGSRDFLQVNLQESRILEEERLAVSEKSCDLCGASM